MDLELRERIVQLRAAGYRRGDIAELCGTTVERVRGHLVALGVVEVRVERAQKKSRRKPDSQRGTPAHWGPQEGEEVEYEE
jgi:hypothetical protein